MKIVVRETKGCKSYTRLVLSTRSSDSCIDVSWFSSSASWVLPSITPQIRCLYSLRQTEPPNQSRFAPSAQMLRPPKFTRVSDSALSEKEWDEVEEYQRAFFVYVYRRQFDEDWGQEGIWCMHGSWKSTWHRVQLISDRGNHAENFIFELISLRWDLILQLPPSSCPS